MSFNPASDHFCNLIGIAQIVAFAYDLGALFLNPNNFIKILLTLLTVYITQGFHLHLQFSLQICIQCVSLMPCEIVVILLQFCIALCVS